MYGGMFSEHVVSFINRLLLPKVGPHFYWMEVCCNSIANCCSRFG